MITVFNRINKITYHMKRRRDFYWYVLIPISLPSLRDQSLRYSHRKTLKTSSLLQAVSSKGFTIQDFTSTASLQILSTVQLRVRLYTVHISPPPLFIRPLASLKARCLAYCCDETNKRQSRQRQVQNLSSDRGSSQYPPTSQVSGEQ